MVFAEVSPAGELDAEEIDFLDLDSGSLGFMISNRVSDK
jgi:hypothetical protein